MLTANRIQHFDPWHIWRQLQGDFDDFWGSTVTAAETPLNLYAKDDAAILVMELPGRSTENVHVAVHRDVVTIDVDAVPSVSPDGATATREERSAGAVTRQVRLPFEVDPQRVEAALERGLLRIHLLRHESTVPAKITVKAR